MQHIWVLVGLLACASLLSALPAQKRWSGLNSHRPAWSSLHRQNRGHDDDSGEHVQGTKQDILDGARGFKVHLERILADAEGGNLEQITGDIHSLKEYYSDELHEYIEFVFNVPDTEIPLHSNSPGVQDCFSELENGQDATLACVAGNLQVMMDHAALTGLEDRSLTKLRIIEGMLEAHSISWGLLYLSWLVQGQERWEDMQCSETRGLADLGRSRSANVDELTRALQNLLNKREPQEARLNAPLRSRTARSVFNKMTRRGGDDDDDFEITKQDIVDGARWFRQWVGKIRQDALDANLEQLTNDIHELTRFYSCNLEHLIWAVILVPDHEIPMSNLPEDVENCIETVAEGSAAMLECIATNLRAMIENADFEGFEAEGDRLTKIDMVDRMVIMESILQGLSEVLTAYENMPAKRLWQPKPNLSGANVDKLYAALKEILKKREPQKASNYRNAQYQRWK